MRREEKRLIVENTQIYRYYYNRLLNIALSQFNWTGKQFVGKEATCDRLYFEKMLLFKGCAAMYKPKDGDYWLSTGYVTKGGLSVYGYPTSIVGYGANAANIEVNPDAWMILYDNMMGETLLPMIDLYAKLLWEIHCTFRINLQKQNTPFVIKSNSDTRLRFTNLMNKVMGFEQVVTVSDKIDLESISTLPLEVQYKGKEFLESLKMIWTEAVSMLGVISEPTKRERLTMNEASMNRQEDMLVLNSRMLNRRTFCDNMNDKFDLDLDVTISSVDTELRVFGVDGEFELEDEDGDIDG